MHHIVPEYVLKRLIKIKGDALGWTQSQRDNLFIQLVDDMPGYLVHQVDHTRRVAGSAADPAGNGIMAIHRIMNKGVNKQGVGLSTSAVREMHKTDILDKMNRAYRNWERPEVGEAAVEWLRQVGLD